jgi:hypothetical protein
MNIMTYGLTFSHVANIINISHAIIYCSMTYFRDFMVFHYLNEP